MIVMSKLPILVLAFNRADHVREAMKSIRDYKPERLYLECDGARSHKVGEKEAVEETRRTMLDAVDWPCEVKTLFREENLGCANAVNGAITWFFEQEEYGIICEDDIILGDDFFKLCEELLPRYAHEDKIMEIAAQNFSGRSDIKNSYTYSYRYHCWGWASWARAWQKMDMSMSAAPNLSYMGMIKKLGFIRGIRMTYLLKYAYKHIDVLSSWATRWYLSIVANEGLLIYPGVNLAINIGMKEGEHYTKWDIDPYSKIKIQKLEWPIKFNDNIVPDKKQCLYDNRDFLKERWYGILKKINKLLRS